MRGKVLSRVQPALLTIAAVLFLTSFWPQSLPAQTLSPSEPQWLTEKLEEGWRKVQEGVLERQSAGGSVETYTYGEEGRRFRVRRLEERINALESEHASHPSQDLEEIVATLESQLTQAEASPGGDQLSAELAAGCEPTLGGQAAAGPLTGAGGPGVTASASASYSSSCGDLGNTYAYAYARATAGSTMNVRSQEDPRNGTELASTAGASSSGTFDCFSEGYAMAASAAPDGPSYEVHAPHYSCTTAISLTIGSPSPGATVGSPFRLKVTENSVNSTALIRILLDGQLIVDDFSAEAVDWNLAAKPGPHTLTARAWAFDGTMTSAEVSFTVSNPAVTVSTPVAGATYTTPIRVLAHENTSRSPVYMQHWLDGVGGKTINGSDTYDWMIDVEPGNHQLTVRSYYSDNTYETTTLDFNVLAGKVNITSPASGATLSSPVHVVGNEDSTRTALFMKVSIDGQEVYSVQNSETVDTYVNVPAGTHWIHITAMYGDYIATRSVMVTVP